ncbi:hypothetical protein ABZ826_35235 [Streptomyces sp. NPDC047515]|uniref:hypothetical protein n=1 Tax=Streptomyces sp. NPDC047515 TaxID=3155380 RepID=UPI00340D93DB
MNRRNLLRVSSTIGAATATAGIAATARGEHGADAATGIEATLEYEARATVRTSPAPVPRQP